MEPLVLLAPIVNVPELLAPFSTIPLPTKDRIPVEYPFTANIPAAPIL